MSVQSALIVRLVGQNKLSVSCALIRARVNRDGFFKTEVAKASRFNGVIQRLRRASFFEEFLGIISVPVLK
jgi:hypothetical protein